jgi:PleD family two-component response regulator
LTISFGIGNWKSHENIDTLIRTADDRLYLAKQAGRNRIVSVT